MLSYRIEITEPAAEDLADLRRYIRRTLEAPGTAFHIYERVKEAIQSLSCLPERNAVVQEAPYNEIGVRRMYVENYTVFYITDSTAARVTILRVLYSRRNWKSIL